MSAQALRIYSPTEPERLTVERLVWLYLEYQRRQHRRGEIVHRTLSDCQITCRRLLEWMPPGAIVDDLRPVDFGGLRDQFPATWSAVTVGNEIRRIKAVFRYALDDGLVDRPVPMGREFRPPSRARCRKEQAADPTPLWTPGDLRRLLGHLRPQLRAMTLLGINCALGDTDCARLCERHLDLAGRWLTYPRPKTGIKRRASLWPETVEALEVWISQRPSPRNPQHVDRVFVTARGNAWTANDIASELRKAARALGIYHRKRNFYRLRHTFRTVADAIGDGPAARLVMGHQSGHVEEVYRHGVDDERLERIAQHVHAWLWGGDRFDER